jgi:hypothetical protein
MLGPVGTGLQRSVFFVTGNQQQSTHNCDQESPEGRIWVCEHSCPRSALANLLRMDSAQSPSLTMSAASLDSLRFGDPTLGGEDLWNSPLAFFRPSAPMLPCLESTCVNVPHRFPSDTTFGMWHVLQAGKTAQRLLNLATNLTIPGSVT